LPAKAEDSLVGELPPLSRLALAYAPAPARIPTLALLALDARLAGIVRRSHEPMLAQLRLAWWREQLGSSHDDGWADGEPILAGLRSWGGAHGPLVALVDGWEAMTGAAPLAAERLALLPAGRGAAFSALAHAIGAQHDAAEALRTGREWALADMLPRLGDEAERSALDELVAGEPWPRARLGRTLRPLAVLHGLARRRRAGKAASPPAGASSMLAAMRIGLLGR
jgi:phytoene synthase